MDNTYAPYRRVDREYPHQEGGDVVCVAIVISVIDFYSYQVNEWIQKREDGPTKEYTRKWYTPPTSPRIIEKPEQAEEC